MIVGAYSVPRVVEESVCRITEDTRLTQIGDYKVHSTTLLPNVEFEESSVEPMEIDDSIFDNDEETKLTFEPTIDCQNFLTVKYIGRAPLEYYGPETKMGREFLLVCRDGNPSYETRVFGTEDAIRGYNMNSNENIQLPKG